MKHSVRVGVGLTEVGSNKKKKSPHSRWNIWTYRQDSFNISNARGHKPAIKLRDALEKKMTKDQISKAQEMAKNWKPKTR